MSRFRPAGAGGAGQYQMYQALALRLLRAETLLRTAKSSFMADSFLLGAGA